MFRSLLIANRGEIACRIIATAKQMGIRTIAVFSDIDAGARHVRLADQAEHIGPSEAIKSYLVAENIIAAAKRSGAEAIHPGYGFLSENPEFAEACVAAGIIFVGPTALSMRQMALKDQAKHLMQSSGVPVTPGYHGEDQDDQVLANAADEIGYPVLIKAVAGGGGRGMRKVDSAGEFLDQLQSARRESLAAFGNDKVLIEKFISNPRHIEVQVFGDTHGNVVHFFERDCSVQRRHQKIIEEAPAPGMSDEMRAAICGAAVKAAQAVDYVNAGTVEFIVDGSGPLDASKFWFMEMNTRLQVEHPVTEAVTSRDLVKLQLHVAAGGDLPKQDQIKLSGHAVEARLYAEQPENNFLPSTGELQWFRGIEADGVRFDTGFEQGDLIAEFYDPMLAKVIVFRENRMASIAALATTLHGIQSWPVQLNSRFLAQILTHPEFVAGTHDTGFIEKNIDALQQNILKAEQIAAMVISEPLSDQSLAGDPWNAADGWRNNALPRRVERLQTQGQSLTVQQLGQGEDQRIVIDGKTVAPAPHQPISSVQDFGDGLRVLFVEGAAYSVSVPDAAAENISFDALGTILAPMPGKILELRTETGAKVRAGEVLVVMEAMKMEHALKAPRDGIVETVAFGVGQQVIEGAVLVGLEE